MLTCSGCGANLRFDIDSQKLICDYCLGQAEPEELDTIEAKQDQSFETMVFECSQCGGELTGDENEASVFCPYCGNSTFLEGRLTKLKRPKYIIPFKINKKDCVKSYEKLLHRSIYAPEEMRKSGVADSFRGIYMPYWFFTMDQKEPMQVIGYEQISRLDGGEINYYRCNYELDNEYVGLTYDASELFDDRLSMAIAPFNVAEKKEFAPGYVSGFYADTFDVEAENYQKNAERFVADIALKQVLKTKSARKYNVQKESNYETLISNTHTQTSASEVALMPVWFMSFKYKDRLAYAGINGQTGKAAGLIPASPMKYLLFSLILAIPFYFLVNMVSYPRPESATLIANALAFLVYLIFDKEITDVVFGEKMGRIQKYINGEPVGRSESGIQKLCRILLIAGVIGAIPVSILFRKLSIHSPVVITMANIALMLMMCFLTVNSVWPAMKELPFPKRYFFLGIPLGGFLIELVNIFCPVSDMYYYAACVVQIITSCLAFIDLIYYHNILATRSMPQFKRTGGDDSVDA